MGCEFAFGMTLGQYGALSSAGTAQTVRLSDIPPSSSVSPQTFCAFLTKVPFSAGPSPKIENIVLERRRKNIGILFFDE